MGDYASLAEVKDALKLTDAALADSDILNALIDAAELHINNFCNRPDGFVADASETARYYAGTGATIQAIDECTEITEVAVKQSSTDTTFTVWATPTGVATADGDWIAYSGNKDRPNFNPLSLGQPYTMLMIDPTGDEAVFTGGQYTTLRGFPQESSIGRAVPTVRVTAKWGYAAAVPDTIKQATIMQTERWYKRQRGGMADTLATRELGQMIFTQKLDPDIELILVGGRYVKPAVGII